MGFVRRDILHQQNRDYHNIYMGVHDRFEGDYKELRDVLNNSKRNRDITKYYQDRYIAYYYLVFVAVIAFFVVMLLSYLEVKNILPSGLLRPIILIIVALSISYLLYLRLDISKRQNIDFNKYIQPKHNTSSGVSSGLNMGSCVGPECCTYGTTFDFESNLCREDR